MEINFFFRANRTTAFSIEEVFNSIQEAVSKKRASNKIHVPHSGAGFSQLKGNIIFAKNNKTEINHITGEVQYLALGLGRNTVMTIHDVGSAFQAGFIKNLLIRILWFWIPSLIVKRISVISEFSKQELVRIIPWAKNKIRVIHNPINQQVLNHASFEINTNSPEKGVFKLLHLGTKANKNLERTIESLKDLPIELTIIGKLNLQQEELLKINNIIFKSLSNLDFEEVIQEYKNCDIVMFASTYEGFGMPIIEAQVLGKPLITSNLGAMKEVALDSAILIDPYSIDSIKKGVQQLISSEKERQTRIEQGYVNIKRFEMDNICNQYLALYNEIKK